MTSFELRSAGASETLEDRRTTQTEAPALARYDAATVWFHWTTALVVAALWGMAQIASFFPKGEARHMLWSAHVALGSLLLVMLAARIGWRAFWGRVLPHTGAKHLQLAKRLTHAMLYFLLVAAVILGAGNVWARGWDLFGFLIIPKYDPASTSGLSRTH